MASEILSYSLTAGVTNSESVLINGVNGHTYTIISVIVTETAAAAETFDLYTMDDGGSTDNFIYKTQALAANATFEHTTRIVLEGTDELGFITGGAANVDVTVSYLDQTLQDYKTP